MAPGETCELPMFPLGAVLLPGEVLPLQVFEPRYLAMIEHCTASPERMRFGVVLIARGNEVGGGDERTGVGTVARITSCRRAPGGRLLLGCVGEERIRVDEWLPDAPYPLARVRSWPDDPSEPSADDVAALTDRITELTDLASTVAGAPRAPDWSQLTGSAGDRAFTLARVLPLGPLDKLRVLTAPTAAERVPVLARAVDDVAAALRFRLGGRG
ncbi:LON peptidase substrate-binding domain-containing protein [Rhodococcus sp. NPDC058505]|uniref:LON peptidase substrate-binding domain-containing protein n=1 Tax=Rhodococcus sp. NPDC058505 TaxID=3346531 RepID=UPI00364A9834